jgi:cytosine/adenosine deaminase-related metal-dependent hydrolase
MDVRASFDQQLDDCGVTIRGGPHESRLSAAFLRIHIRAACDEANALGKRSIVHAQGPEGAKAAVLAGCTSIEHGNMLTDREFDLIAETRGTVTITPSTDMLMQFGTFPATGPALSRGIVSGFGIDTICSAGNDLFSEMRLALAAERSRVNAPVLASGKQVPTVDLHQRDMLRLATIDGARVWHLEDEEDLIMPVILDQGERKLLGLPGYGIEELFLPYR